MISSHRVLVVEDHGPFRRAICDLLQQHAQLLVVGEAADGPDAIEQAEALRPDVVLLDIGLPAMSGIEVAARLRTKVPGAKVMFVTNEASLDVVEQAFQRGAHGYVYKPRVWRDLFPVLDSIVRGGRFVSGGLERIARGDSLASHRHHVAFYANDSVLVGAFSRFIAGALQEGHAVITAVTEAHDLSLRQRLHGAGVDVALAVRQGRYVPVSISDVLAHVMVNGRPDAAQFLNATGDVVTEAARRATSRHANVSACGECSATVWAQGHLEAAIQLEHLFDELANSHQIDMLCAYPLTTRDESVTAVRSLCAAHTTVEIRTDEHLHHPV